MNPFEAKTLSAWLLDPKTSVGDEFVPDGPLDGKVVIGKTGELWLAKPDRDKGWTHGDTPAPTLNHYRMKWVRHFDLDKITAQRALELGLVRRHDR